MNDYYVYVYIDPRNLQEFYYGKGQGARKDAHLGDTGDSAKARTIAAIRKEGLAPIIRVIARGLSEREALLVEKTLLWRLGRGMTNVASGHFAENFRPQNTLHRELAGFDFRNGIYYYNVGEGSHRCWADYVRYGFISAGQGAKWRDAMLGFRPGDVLLAYLKRRGFVGVGRVLDGAVMVRDFRVDGIPLLTLPLAARDMGENSGDKDYSEYVVRVEWFRTLEPDQAIFPDVPRLFTTTHVRASLDNQQGTVDFLEQAFGVNIRAEVS